MSDILEDMDGYVGDDLVIQKGVAKRDILEGETIELRPAAPPIYLACLTHHRFNFTMPMVDHCDRAHEPGGCKVIEVMETDLWPAYK